MRALALAAVVVAACGGEAEEAEPSAAAVASVGAPAADVDRDWRAWADRPWIEPAGGAIRVVSGEAEREAAFLWCGHECPRGPCGVHRGEEWTSWRPFAPLDAPRVVAGRVAEGEDVVVAIVGPEPLGAGVRVVLRFAPIDGGWRLTRLGVRSAARWAREAAGEVRVERDASGFPAAIELNVVGLVGRERVLAQARVALDGPPKDALPAEVAAWALPIREAKPWEPLDLSGLLGEPRAFDADAVAFEHAAIEQSGNHLNGDYLADGAVASKVLRDRRMLVRIDPREPWFERPIVYLHLAPGASGWRLESVAVSLVHDMMLGGWAQELAGTVRLDSSWSAPDETIRGTLELRGSTVAGTKIRVSGAFEHDPAAPPAAPFPPLGACLPFEAR